MWGEGDIAAFYGGIKRRVLFRGKAANTLQCVDTMVATTDRGSLSKKGPYYLAATKFLDKYIGYNRPYLFGFGFPNKRVMRLGEHLGVQADIGSVVELVWPGLDQCSLKSVALDFDSDQHLQLLEKFWQDMAQDLTDKIVIVRDPEYLKYRYCDHPSLEYELRLVTGDDDEPLGVVVTRIHEERLLLLDCISAVANFPELAVYCRGLATEKNCKGLFAWITEADSYLFDCPEMTINDIGVRIPTSICTDGPSPDELKNTWFLMAGDTDFL